MRSRLLIIGSIAAGLAVPYLSARTQTVNDNSTVAERRADIAKDRRQLHYDLKHAHFLRAKRDRAALRRDERMLRNEMRGETQ